MSSLLSDTFVTRFARDGVRVTGGDATTYLQSQLSQDLATVDVGAAARSFLLQPNGHVIGWFRVIRLEEDVYLLDTEPGWGGALADRLERFKLRTKVDFKAETWWGTGVRGPDAESLIAEIDRIEGDVRVSLDWPGVDGVDLLCPASLGSGHQVDGEVIDTEAADWLRIKSGVPEMGREVGEKTIPGELGDWVMTASVSFTKGCYTGQELVARVDSRGGNVPKPIRRLTIDGETVPPVGATVTLDGVESGHLTSAGMSPDGVAVALGVVARRIVPPSTVVVCWEGNEVAAQVTTLQS